MNFPYTLSSQKPADKNIIFAYDLKSISKHFIVGTSVIDHVDELVRYDDYPIIRQKKGLQVKSLSFYRDQEKVVGYEIVYKDAQNNTTTLKRIAPNFRSFGFKSYKEQKVLHYNEHLADIDVVHTQNEIEFIDILTSKGKHIKVFEEKLDDDEKCTSFNKIDIRQKNYAPIIAFETTFSKDRLKELFVYRCPVRISKRRKQANLTVNELNHLKAAPTLQTTLRAQQNISILRNFTLKEINQRKVVRGWQNLANETKTKIISSNTTLETPSIRLETLADQQKSREAFMEEQEYGVDDEDEEEKEDKKDKKSPPRKKSIFLFNPFGQRKQSVSSSNSPDKIKNKDDTFESQIKKFTNTLFGKKTGSSSASTSRRASVGAALYKDPNKLAKFDAEYMQRKLERQKDLEKNEQMDFTLNKAKSPRDPQEEEVQEVQEVQERSDSPKSPPRREKKSKTSAPVTPLQGWKKYSENVRSKLKAFAIFNEPNDNQKGVHPEGDEILRTEQSPITYEMGDDDEDEVVVQGGGMNYRNKRAINFQSNSNSNSNSQSDSDSDSGSGSQSKSQSKSQSQSQSQSQSRQSHSRSQSRKQSHHEK